MTVCCSGASTVIAAPPVAPANVRIAPNALPTFAEGGGVAGRVLACSFGLPAFDLGRDSGSLAGLKFRPGEGDERAERGSGGGDCRA